MQIISRPHPCGLSVIADTQDDLVVEVVFHDGSSRDASSWLADLVLVGLLNPPPDMAGISEDTVLFGDVRFSSDDVRVVVRDALGSGEWQLSFAEVGFAASRGVTVLLQDPLDAE